MIYKMKNILITGGAGFIGSSVALKLVDKGYNVTVLDNLSKQIHGENPDTSFLYNRIIDKVNFIKGDVILRADWEKSLLSQDAVIHLAAETGTGQSMYEIEKYTKVNIGGTAILMDILTNTKTNVKKVIVASSRAIYGEGKYLCEEHGTLYPHERKEQDMLNNDFENKCPVCGKNAQLKATDETSQIHPSSIYGITKHVQEQMVLLSCKSINIPAVAYRYQNVYGPGQSLKNPYTGILSIFSVNMLHNEPINIFEDGQESRDFIYIDDAVDAMILGLEKQEADYQVFNVGSGKSTTVEELAEILKSNYKSNSEIIISGNFRLGDIRHNYADISKINKLLGFVPKYNFEQGIKLFTNWVKTENIDGNNLYQESLSEMRNKGLLK
jgi:dTDP-L-rhamnose 4-epimerase